MYKRISALILCLVLIIFSFSGCFGRTKSDKPFAVPIVGEPSSLDPQIAKTDSEKIIIQNAFEGLVRINENDEIQNGVAESYTVSDDGLTYTFNLRHNAHWALFSGHKALLGDDYDKTFDINVYAEDFEFAFDRVFDSAISSPYLKIFDCISSYKALDKHTFQINLKYNDENFLRYLTYPGAMPCDKEFFELTGGKYGLDAKYTLCNGPFNVSRWTENTSIRLVKNNDYNGENKVKPSSITFYINSSNSAVAEKMATGTYDMAFLSNIDYASLSNKDDYNAVEIKNTVYSMIFNQSNKYLENKNIRLALVHSVDLDSISIDENAQKATGIIPPSCKIGNLSYISGDSKILGYDREKAKDYFEQGLLEVGDSSVELEIKCTQEHELFVKQLIQGMQKSLGVKFVVTVNVLEKSQLDAAVADGDYAVIFYPFTAESENADEFLESFNNNPVFNYNSQDYINKLEEFKTNAGDYNQLRLKCDQAENILINDAVMLPVLFEDSYLITDKDTAGIYYYSSKGNVCFINATKK